VFSLPAQKLKIMCLTKIKSKNERRRPRRSRRATFNSPVSNLGSCGFLIIGSIVGLALLHNHINTPTNQITEAEFFQKVDANLIAKGNH